ncbi:hypothetical protein J5X84_26695 [Streptosporangiaceae bacterium NEAU-GS5]|nr:hypothetical protein [Streptosporangiaceae bacterium NEAU-GS5]
MERFATRECLTTLTADRASNFYSVAFSPDGTLLAGGNTDGKVLVWKI